MLLKHRSEQHKKLFITNYTVNKAKILEKARDGCILGIIIPILEKDAERELHQQIADISKEISGLDIFILAVFADMDAMVALTASNHNISVVNNICLSDVEPLIKMLHDNCRTSEYNFSKDEVLIEVIMDVCRREASNEVEILE